jgi:hypothetical protein
LMMCRTRIRRRNQKYGIMSDNSQRRGNPVPLLHTELWIFLTVSEEIIAMIEKS